MNLPTLPTDPISQKAIEKATELAVEEAWGMLKSVATGLFSLGKKAVDAAHEKYEEHQGLKEYARKLVTRHQYIKVLGMSQPVLLETLYVRVNVLEKITSRQAATIEDLEQLFDRDKRTFGKKQMTISGEQAIQCHQYMMVLGKPGAGKSTFLRRMLIEMLKGKLESKRIPLFISLHELSQTKKTLIDFIETEFNICGYEDAGPFIEKLLQAGKAMILLDGLDEVSEDTNLDEVIRDIRNFMDKYDKNQFVISCRVAAYNHWFNRCTDIEIADFDNEQIKQFVHNYFSQEPEDIAKKCLNELENQPPVQELARIPLLLTLLCISFEANYRFPANKADLYREAIDALMHKWDSSRRIHREDAYKRLTQRHKEGMLAKMAYETFIQNQYFVPKRRFEELIREYIENIPGFDEKDLEADSEAILKSIESQHYIVSERAKNIYSFSHLTFQEYFVAKFIIDNFSSMHIKNIKSDKTWIEVFSILSGMFSMSDDFIKIFYERHKLHLKNKNIRIKCIYLYGKLQEKGLSNNEVNDAIYNAFLLQCSMSFINFLIKDSLLESIDILFEYKNSEILEMPKRNVRSKIVEPFIMNIKILLMCINSASYISKSLRKEIEENLFNVSEDFSPDSDYFEN